MAWSQSIQIERVIMIEIEVRDNDEELETKELINLGHMALLFCILVGGDSECALTKFGLIRKGFDECNRS